MTITEIRKYHRAEPFVPFEVHLADGRSFAVDDPEFLSISQTGRTIYISVADGVEVVDLLLVTSLKVRPNGSRRRRA